MGDFRFGQPGVRPAPSAHSVTAKATQTLVASITSEMVKLRHISSSPLPLDQRKWQLLDESLGKTEHYLKDLIELALWGVKVETGSSG